MRSTPPPLIGIAARTMGALTSESFVWITKLSNGFVVHYKKAAVVKRPNPALHYADALPPDVRGKLDTLLNKAMDKMGEGEEWKEGDEKMPNPVPPFVDCWMIEERAMACLTEVEVAKTFTDVVAAIAEIEQLYAKGLLNQGYS